MKVAVKVIFLLLPLVFLESCFTDSDCFNLRNDVMVIAFKKDDNGAADALNIVDVSIVESQYEFSGPTGPVDKISLPLDPSKNEQRIEFTFLEPDEPSEQVLRRIDISYNVKTQFESTDCEPKFFFSALSIVRYSDELLSAKVVDDLPQQQSSGVNIEIAYR